MVLQLFLSTQNRRNSHSNWRDKERWVESGEFKAVVGQNMSYAMSCVSDSSVPNEYRLPQV